MHVFDSLVALKVLYHSVCSAKKVHQWKMPQMSQICIKNFCNHSNLTFNMVSLHSNQKFWKSDKIWPNSYFVNLVNFVKHNFAKVYQIFKIFGLYESWPCRIKLQAVCKRFCYKNCVILGVFPWCIFSHYIHYDIKLKGQLGNRKHAPGMQRLGFLESLGPK